MFTKGRNSNSKFFGWPIINIGRGNTICDLEMKFMCIIACNPLYLEHGMAEAALYSITKHPLHRLPNLSLSFMFNSVLTILYMHVLWFVLYNTKTTGSLYVRLYPTYDVDQTYRQGNILDIALWLRQYHDIALWYSWLLLVPGPVVRLRNHTCNAITTVGYKPVNTPCME